MGQGSRIRLFSKVADAVTTSHVSRLIPTARAYAHVAGAIVKNVHDRPGLPRSAHVIPTWRCDLKCATCKVWRKSSFDDEIDTEAWRGVIRKLRCLDIVKIIGGEPFARPDLAEICEAVFDEIDPWLVQITSAGTRTDEILGFLDRVGRPGLQLRISLDGFEDSYRKLRGAPEAFHAVNRTLQDAAAMSEKRGFTLGVNFCVTDESVADLPDMIAYCRELGVDCVPGIAVKPFLEHVEDWSAVEHKVLMATDVERISAALADARIGAKEGMGWLVRRYLRGANERVYRDRLTDGSGKRFRCREVRDLAYIMPNADVVICGLRYDPVGSLRTHTVEQIWDSPEATRARGVVDACRGCNQASTEILSRLYTGYWSA